MHCPGDMIVGMRTGLMLLRILAFSLAFFFHVVLQGVGGAVNGTPPALQEDCSACDIQHFKSQDSHQRK